MSEKKNIKKLPIIRTREQLKMILDGLYNQGFGYYVGDYKAHDVKVEKLINSNNTLNMDENKYGHELKDIVRNMTNYVEIDRTIKKYFKKFKPDDKIKELINKFHLKEEFSISSPSNWSPNKSDIIDWVNFKKKYNLKGEPHVNKVYNLDKNFIKLVFWGEHRENHFKFTQLYKLIYGENPNEWSAKNIGDWQDLGKIEIKIFQNDTINIKGDIDKLKKFQYKYGISKRNCVIFYNNKKEIIESN